MTSQLVDLRQRYDKVVKILRQFYDCRTMFCKLGLCSAALVAKCLCLSNHICACLCVHLQYTSEFVQSHLLSRRLAYFCCKKLSQVCADASTAPLSSPTSQFPAPVAASSSSNEYVFLIIYVQRDYVGSL